MTRSTKIKNGAATKLKKIAGHLENIEWDKNDVDALLDIACKLKGFPVGKSNNLNSIIIDIGCVWKK